MSETYPVAHFAPDRGLDDAARMERHGDAFLVLMPAALNRPVHPQSTAFVDTKETLDAPAPAVNYRVCPVRKRGQALSSPHVTVGRTANNDVVLADVSVSKVHAFLRRDGARYLVQDAGSRNGTFVDEVAVQAKGKPVRLASGARVRFGTVAVLFLEAKEFWRLVDGLAANDAAGQ
jgi:pSer/pThr/pTyr-binding forkhead associated (FHA) protein